MCGVIGLIYEKHRSDLGVIGAELLKTLEYRGYDSTGAAIQGEGCDVVLRKGVGAPSIMVDALGITDLAGSIMCGQVRWATFGSVDDVNAQPHVVRCKTHLYGAHNGNVTNCDDLAEWLASEGHDVLSDNDGEMVVHTVEHYFSIELEARPASQREADEVRRTCMRAAIVRAGDRLKGSFAAVVVDPVSRTVWAIKEGSSLYFGFGHDDEHGAFAIASSDLSSVLKLTRALVSVSEGECVEFGSDSHTLFATRNRGSIRVGDEIERSPRRSRLQAKDAALQPQFKSFMEQEITAQIATCRRIGTLFSGGSPELKSLAPYFQAWSEDEHLAIHGAVTGMADEYDDDAIHRRFIELVEQPSWSQMLHAVPAATRERLAGESGPQLKNRLTSLEAGLLADLLDMAGDDDERFSVRLLDVLFELDELEEFCTGVALLTSSFIESIDAGGRAFMVCCGSSYHAALAGSVFFNEIAHAEVVPVLPGEFRARYAASLRSQDLVIAVSQSGETKDLIDVMNGVIESGLDVHRVAIVNNVSSTLGQEKCDIVLPLGCGPEIAVPATKSYMNQVAILYCLALRLAEARIAESAAPADDAWKAMVELRSARLEDLPQLIRETLTSTEIEVEKAAELLFLKPSMHLLSTRLLAIAKEGALKIREVVLNHTEGFEASEFKHGPNTILGVNTIFGIEDVVRFAKGMNRTVQRALEMAQTQGLPPESGRRIAQAITDSSLSLAITPFALTDEEKAIFESIFERDDPFRDLYDDYPLVFITGPDRRDVDLTISQVNTHKIRGATCVMIAEEESSLRQALTKAPSDNPGYQSVYITLPRTNDNLMVMFSATVVLQRLALRMSLLKQEYLEHIGLKEHGVHPDVPKNVSKSITVD